MKNVSLLLAGPGTGKTTRVKQEVKTILKANPEAKLLVLSFTNATVKDLLSDLSELGVDNKNCMTLHSFALKLNHSTDKHILDHDFEEKVLREYAELLKIDFDELCRLLNCTTFNQMIIDCVAFIRTNPTYAKDKIGDLDLLLVDEYQDFNAEERELIFSAIDYSKQTIVLGDDDQCIYGFKNADSDGIISLYSHADVKKISHENICYRCPKDVVVAGNTLIKRNKNRVPKEWNAHNSHTGLSAYQTRDQQETNNLLSKLILDIKKTNPEATLMVLSSVNFAVKPIVEQLKAASVEYTNWWQGKIELEVMEKIWWLRAIFSKHRFLNLMFLLKPKLKGKQKSKVRDLLTKRLQHGENEESIIDEIAQQGLIDAGLIEFTLTTPSVENFIKQMPVFEPFSKYLLSTNMKNNIEKLSTLLAEQMEFEKGKVNFMSIHKSKGLQADHVFIVGLVEGILPNESNAVDSLEAQRRLFFVALSRAKTTLSLVSQINWATADLFKGKADTKKFRFFGKKMMKGEASLFIRELS